MNYEAFRTELGELLRSRNPSKIVTINQNIKNNDVILYGLSMREQDEHISCNIYLESFYDDFVEGRSLESIVNKIEQDVQEHICDIEYDIVQKVNEFDFVKDKIIYKLINTEYNHEFLKDVPHRDWMNLSIIYKIDLGEYGDHTASINVTNNLLKIWNTTEEELFALAKVNTPKRRKLCIKGLFYVVENMISNFSDTEINESFINECRQRCEDMLVVTNEVMIEGAVSILYEETLEELKQRIGNRFYVIPSSVHEMLVIGEEDREGMKLFINEMIKDVNDSKVAYIEILSNNAYFYNGEEFEMIQ